MIASALLDKATNSFPIIDKLVAKRVFLLDNPLYQTLKISVYLHFQGRSALRYTHILAYDPEEQDKFLYDSKEKSGLDFACHLVNTEVNSLLDRKPLETLEDVEDLLAMFYRQKLDSQSQIGVNVIKACSEAILYGAAKCYEQVDLYKGIRDHYFPMRVMEGNEVGVRTKLLFTIFNGGKSLGSQVKFGKFYLIIDPWQALMEGQEIEIVDCFVRFQQAIKKAITSTKQGEAGFKPGPEGSYFNAFGNINETFKCLEDAINQS